MLPETRIAATADVDPRSAVGEGSVVWHLAQIREGAVIGSECTIGRGVYVGPGVVLGDRVKVQNLAQVYEPAVIGDGAFIGPAVVLTNDLHPRAVGVDGTSKSAEDWDAVGVRVGPGASLGARSVCIAPVRIGRWAMVAAGAVVTRDVLDHALVVGVPARRVGWVGRAGIPLRETAEGSWTCERTGERYEITDSGARLVTGD